MSKFLLFISGLLALIAIAGKANAQGLSGSSISFGPEVVFPLHTTSHGYVSDGYYRDGGGFSATFEVPLLDELKFTLSAGYQFYLPVNKVYNTGVYYTCLDCVIPPSPPADDHAYEYVPLIAGLHYYYYKYLFVSFEAGDAFEAGGRTLNSFIYGGGFGGDIPINKHNSIELMAGDEGGFKSIDFDYSVAQIYIKAAYKYSF